MDCLKNIVGLSPTSCNCWDASKPIDFAEENASSSGLYVSQQDTISLRWTNSASDCEKGGVWDMLIAARDSAIRDTLQSFLEVTQAKKQERFIPFTKIGDSYFKSGEVVNEVQAATWIEPYKIRGAKLKVSSVSLAFWSGVNVNKIVNVDVYSSLDLTTSLGTATATITTNKQFFDAVFATPLEIDLSKVRMDLNERFYFTYTIPGGCIPVKNNAQIGCGCGGTNEIIENPYLQIMQLGGIQAATVEDFGLLKSNTPTLNGMLINAVLDCDYYSWLCDLAQKPQTASVTLGSGQRLSLGMTLADTIQARAVANLVEAIIMSSRINQFTMVQGVEELYKKKGHFNKIFAQGIENLVYYTPADVSECLVCQNDKRINKSPILA